MTQMLDGPRNLSMDAMARYEGPLRDSMGDEMFDERAVKRRQTLSAIDAGLLSRFRYSATRSE